MYTFGAKVFDLRGGRMEFEARIALGHAFLCHKTGIAFSQKHRDVTNMASVRDLLNSLEPQSNVTVRGWVRTRRDGKTCSFLEINDGSCLKNLQAVIDHTTEAAALLPKILTGASVELKGDLVPSPGSKQKWELHARQLSLIGPADATYPLQKKGHSLEFLRTIAHLRPRTNLFGAVLRTRSQIAFAVHEFFQSRGFIYVHTPIITTSDCEGAGELFRVITRSAAEGKAGEEFFGRPAYLTVSGQLEAEALACALSKVYTFGPTFRAENSNTARHASEFWMIEPEMAFYDLNDDIELAETFIKAMAKAMLERCEEDLQFFEERISPDIRRQLEFVIERPFERISYTEAIGILERSQQRFEFPVKWGMNLQSEHERYLTETYFKKPVTVYNYPRELKPFYMRLNDDGKTVAAMDLLVPSIGEVIGGSQREERLDVLLDNMKLHGLNPDDYWWYIDLRRYGSVPHSGFGVGFERLLMFLTGMGNIRDVIPFPRTPGHAEF